MSENILKQIESRTKFLLHLNEEIEKNDRQLELAREELKLIEKTEENINVLSRYPEQISLIPLGKKIYLPGRITHTGEYTIRKDVGQESFHMLKSANQVKESLEVLSKDKSEVIKLLNVNKNQLEERKHVLLGELSENKDKEDIGTQNMPKEIHSDKGIAVKVGDFYEIMEFEQQA